MKHLIIPDDIRKLYKRAVYVAYDAICGDCPEMETYSRKAKMEIIRDANHLETIGCQGMNVRSADRDKLSTWLKAHAYDPQYERDQKRAIREVIG